jgi:hypothetical protein
MELVGIESKGNKAPDLFGMGPTFLQKHGIEAANKSTKTSTYNKRAVKSPSHTSDGSAGGEDAVLVWEATVDSKRDREEGTRSGWGGRPSSRRLFLRLNL